VGNLIMLYTFDDYKKDVDLIIEQIQARGDRYDYIVGVARGGLIPAVYLSHRLGIPMRSVSWSTFHANQVREYAWDIADDIHNGKRILLVDDILDSGQTAAELIKDWEIQRDEIDMAVLIYNVDQNIIPDFYGRSISREVQPYWFNFWWETDTDTVE
jgi:uncharacterized protein